MEVFHINPHNFRIWKSHIDYLAKLGKYYEVVEQSEVEKADAALNKALVKGLLVDEDAGILKDKRINLLIS
jgi:hypothetical protein